MPTINLKPAHKILKTFYKEINSLSDPQINSEGIIAPAFAHLLRHCASQFALRLFEQYPINPKGKRPLKADGAFLDQFELCHGIWETKDIKDNPAKEIKNKLAEGYPKNNILFQTPNRLILWQDGKEVFNKDFVTAPTSLIEGLNLFFDYRHPAIEQWIHAVDGFKEKIKEYGNALLSIIENELQTNQPFIEAFDGLTQLCLEVINPNLSQNAVKEMLIQHLLIERIFRKVFEFDNPDFIERNVIAREIEKVIAALISPSFSRHEFFKKLDPFYSAIETVAAMIDDYAQKQDFLNAVYEKFFQGFATKVAETHGIAYTPLPIVKFMVKSVAEILQKEFGTSLDSKGLHILDPFVGTGNFIVRLMQQISPSQLKEKYLHELHCNEVMLLSYYTAALKIEHAYYEITGQYEPFKGICLVDSLELAEKREKEGTPLKTENTARVNQQKNSPIFVMIGNPPYHIGQLNENDDNKNRQYKVVDKWVAETYTKASKATNKNALSDPYVKAIRWAPQLMGEEGIVAFVTNSSFVDGIAFDGMRQHLAQHFSKIYVLDLGGNLKQNPKLLGAVHNVLGIQVGVSINFLVKKVKKESTKTVEIFYARMGEFWRKEAKFRYLEKKQHIGHLDWQSFAPGKNHIWLTEGLHPEFDTFIPLGTKAKKAAKTEVDGVIFKTYSRGAETTRDAWVYHFYRKSLIENVNRFIEVYNTEVDRWHNRTNTEAKLNDFVLNDRTKIKWSSRLKECLLMGKKATFEHHKIRHSLYRPFSFKFLFFDRILTHRQGQIPVIFPLTETENKTICVKGVGMSQPFHVLMASVIPDVQLTPNGQCFPFYIYNKDGAKRKENITEWALSHYRQHYQDDSITKWDIFHYVYGLLHHPLYREKYAANLKRDLPHIPLVSDFWGFYKAGQQLADCHVNYEDQPEYAFNLMVQADMQPDWRVEKMKLSNDKTRIIYNKSLTIGGIPPEVFEYRLGNRSALEWAIDQFRVKTDRRSGIVSDPNRLDDERYIVRLISQVITVSLKTVEIVKTLEKYSKLSEK